MPVELVNKKTKHIYKPNTYTNTHIYKHTHIQIYKHTHIQTHTYTNIQTHTYTNTHIYKHTHIQTHTCIYKYILPALHFLYHPAYLIRSSLRLALSASNRSLSVSSFTYSGFLGLFIPFDTIQIQNNTTQYYIV